MYFSVSSYFLCVFGLVWVGGCVCMSEANRSENVRKQGGRTGGRQSMRGGMCALEFCFEYGVFLL